MLLLLVFMLVLATRQPGSPQVGEKLRLQRVCREGSPLFGAQDESCLVLFLDLWAVLEENKTHFLSQPVSICALV